MNIFSKNKILPFLFLALSLKVSAQSVGGTIAGTATFCSPSGAGVISLSGNVGSILYWESSTDTITWTNIGGANSTLEYYSALTQTTWYRAIVKNGASPSVASSYCSITVYPTSVGGTVTGGGVFCIGAGYLTLTGYVGSILNWLSSTDGGITWSNIANSTASCPYSVSQSTIFSAVVKNTTYCPVDTAVPAYVTLSTTKAGTAVINPYSGGTIAGGATYCGASDSGNIKLTGYVGKVLYWLSSTNGGSTLDSVINDTTDLLKYSTITQNTSFAAAVQLGTCAIDTSASVRFTIENTVGGKIVNADTTVEYQNNSNTLILSGSTGNKIEWQYSTNNGVAWNVTGNNTVTLPSEGLKETTKYRVTVQQNSCKKDTSNIVTITVLPRSLGEITNLFTPNGDGINDTWFIKGLNHYENNEVSVYNTYGVVVFSQKGYKNDWKGTYNGAELPDGTYYYVIKLGEDKEKIIKGSLDIVRGK